MLKSRVTSSTEFGLLWASQTIEPKCAEKRTISAQKRSKANSFVALARCSSCENRGPVLGPDP